MAWQCLPHVAPAPLEFSVIGHLCYNHRQWQQPPFSIFVIILYYMPKTTHSNLSLFFLCISLLNEGDFVYYYLMRRRICGEWEYNCKICQEWATRTRVCKMQRDKEKGKRGLEGCQLARSSRLQEAGIWNPRPLGTCGGWEGRWQHHRSHTLWQWTEQISSSYGLRLRKSSCGYRKGRRHHWCSPPPQAVVFKSSILLVL